MHGRGESWSQESRRGDPIPIRALFFLTPKQFLEPDLRRDGPPTRLVHHRGSAPSLRREQRAPDARKDGVRRSFSSKSLRVHSLASNAQVVWRPSWRFWQRQRNQRSRCRRSQARVHGARGGEIIRA